MTFASARQHTPDGPGATVEIGHTYFDETTAARYLGFARSSRRLKELRLTGGGPRYVRIGQAVRYRSDWLDAWAEASAVSSTSEEAARRRA
jgi:hypothetical protein